MADYRKDFKKVWTFDLASLLPFSSVRSMPPRISFCLISGMLTQFAAATAANGTYLCKCNKIESLVRI